MDRRGLKTRLKSVLRVLLGPILKIVQFYRSRYVRRGAVCYFPVFTTVEELANHYHRAAWYLPRVPGVCNEVVFFIRFPVRELPPAPPHFRVSPSDPPPHFRFIRRRRSPLRTFLRSRLVVIWKRNRWSVLAKFARLCGIHVINVETEDPEAVEYGNYCGLLWRWSLKEKDRRAVIEENRRRFLRVAEEIEAEGFTRAAVFGTGPSLEKAYDYDFSGCLTIACNTIVMDDRLLDHIRPRFLCVADPVYHYGVSRYAEVYRKDLLRVVRERDVYIVGIAPYGYLLLQHHPELRDRMILLEQRLTEPNFDLRRNFSVPYFDSVLNIVMLPLAATFSREIWILGCDGKSAKRDNEDFWAHARGLQYLELLDGALACHPTFDPRRQKRTYRGYLDSIEYTVDLGERLHGIRYHTLQPSNIAALNERLVADPHQDAPVEGNPVGRHRRW